MSKSISYHPFLLDNLKDPNYAALYLETHLEEDEFEFDPELLKMALRNVLEALGDSHLTAEQIKIYEQFLDKLLTMPAEFFSITLNPKYSCKINFLVKKGKRQKAKGKGE